MLKLGRYAPQKIQSSHLKFIHFLIKLFKVNYLILLLLTLPPLVTGPFTCKQKKNILLQALLHIEQHSKQLLKLKNATAGKFKKYLD